MTVDLTLLFASRKNVRQRLSSVSNDKGRLSVVHRLASVFRSLTIWAGLQGGVY